MSKNPTRAHFWNFGRHIGGGIAHSVYGDGYSDAGWTLYILRIGPLELSLQRRKAYPKEVY